LHPEAASWAAWSAVFRADFPRATEFVATRDAAYAASGVEPSAASYQGPITLALFTGDLDRAYELASAAKDAAVREANDYQRVQALTMLAASTQQEVVPADALAAMEEAAELARRVGAPGTISWTLAILGAMLVRVDPQRALVVLDEAEPLCRAVGNDQAAAQALMGVAWAHLNAGDPVSALEAARRSWEYAASVGARIQTATSLVVGAFALAALDKPNVSLRLLGYAGVVYQSFWGIWDAMRTELLATQGEALGADAVDALTRDGAGMDEDAALALARATATAVLHEDPIDEGTR
jgi:hypothetical protein